MKRRFMEFMAGRYGADQFGKFLSIFSMILLVIGLIFRRTLGTVTWYAAILLLAWSYFRMLSRKTDKRYRENQKYLLYKSRVTGYFLQQKTRFSQRKQYRFFKCPNCKVTVRVPRNKGRIEITCPKCRNCFVEKT